jgi:hypothetical protein
MCGFKMKIMGWILDKNKGVDIGCVNLFKVMQKKSFNLLGFNRKGSLFHNNIICNTFRATICKHSMRAAMGSKFSRFGDIFHALSECPSLGLSWVHGWLLI